MNEELTREVLEVMKKCEYPRCGFCELPKEKSCKSIKKAMRNLATAMLEERAKPKVWDGAPDEAGRAAVHWYLQNGSCRISDDYTREIPKTSIDIIAEETAEGYYGEMRLSKTDIIGIAKKALTKYAEELKGEV